MIIQQHLQNELLHVEAVEKTIAAYKADFEIHRRISEFALYVWQKGGSEFKENKSIYAELKAISKDTKFSDINQLEKNISNILKSTKEFVEIFKELLSIVPKTAFIQRLMIKRGIHLFKRSYSILEKCRTFILEHEADLDKSVNGPFSSVDELIDHLNS